MPEANYLLSVSWGYIKVRCGLRLVCLNELFFFYTYLNVIVFFGDTSVMERAANARTVL